MISTATAQVRVVQPGPMTLVQDRGRVGFQQLGVSVSGAVDSDALVLGNRIVGNNPDAAALEVMLGGLILEFSDRTVFAVCGADMEPSLDGVPLSQNVSYLAHAGSSLELGVASNGLRSYIAVAGGIDVAEILGSRSTHVASGIGGLEGRALRHDDVLNIGAVAGENRSGAVLEDPAHEPVPAELNIRVVLGPQDDEFSDSGIETFLNSGFVVTDQSNRQGLRLDGPVIESKTGRYDIVSDAVVNGSIQIPGDGKPIILLADRQTTGGYAKIATVASVDLPKLGQAPPGTTVSFTEISVAEAQQLFIERSERFESATIDDQIDQISLQVDSETVVVGTVDLGASWLAVVDGVGYPISFEEITPAE